MFGVSVIAALVNSIVSGISGYFHDKSAEAQARLAIEAALVDFARQVDTGQIELNKVEAASTNIFISGWRPAIGWMGAIALGYNFLVQPILDTVLYLSNSSYTIPQVDLNVIIGLVTAMLGFGGLRTYEKVKGLQ